jgi:outer membrane protein assembly factor BamD
MLRRILVMVLFAALLALTAACTNKKSANPLANVGTKQPDKVLFDKAMDAMRHNRFDVARLTLQTLINTYPDSEFIARAKLAECDSWYAEGGTASLAQSEQCYDDFETFFPNMPEAAEAQLKIANIHYQQMEKPDRDYTHALRAEEEYRKMITQYPDSKLIPEAKQRLLEVQEVLAEREFEIGRFYYLRESYLASMARLQSLVETYPLYSKADEALYLLGQDYEAQIARLRGAPTCDVHGLPRGCVREAEKAIYIKEQTQKAADAYSLILTRYPIMLRADDAKKRLEALHEPIPRPTKAALAENKAEDASRHEATTAERLMGLVRKGPDVSEAAKVGEPTLVDPPLVSVQEVLRNDTIAAINSTRGEKALEVGVLKAGTPAPNEAAPRSDQPPAGNAADNSSAGPLAAGNVASATANSADAKPAAQEDPNELKPIDSQAALPPPPQVNEIHSEQSSSSAKAANDSDLASDKDISSSKKKKKKGLRKIVPF